MYSTSADAPEAISVVVDFNVVIPDRTPFAISDKLESPSKIIAIVYSLIGASVKSACHASRNVLSAGKLLTSTTK